MRKDDIEISGLYVYEGTLDGWTESREFVVEVTGFHTRPPGKFGKAGNTSVCVECVRDPGSEHRDDDLSAVGREAGATFRQIIAPCTDADDARLDKQVAAGRAYVRQLEANEQAIRVLCTIGLDPGQRLGGSLVFTPGDFLTILEDALKGREKGTAVYGAYKQAAEILRGEG